MILLLLACAGSDADGKDPADTSVESASDETGPPPDSGDSGLDSGADSGDTADSAPDTGDTGEPDPWDTAPVYPCPEPTDDAIVLDALAYLGDATTSESRDGFTGLWLTTRSVNYAVDRCYTNDSIYGPLFDEEPDTWGIELSLVADPDYPVDYQGLHTWAEVMDEHGTTLFNYWGSFFRMDGGYERRWYFDPYEHWTGSADLCLSEVRPDHLSGVLLYTSDPDNPYGALSFYFRFTFIGEDPSDMAEFDDGTCFYYEYFGVEESEVWAPSYGDTGG